MKDQPTEASMNPLNVYRLRCPTARLHQPQHVRPIAVEQGQGMVEREGIGGVFGRRMNG